MQWIRSAFLEQLRYQSFHTMVRISFGFLLWTAWVRLKLDLSVGTYLLALLMIACLIAFAWRWTRQPEKENVPESENDIAVDSGEE